MCSVFSFLKGLYKKNYIKRTLYVLSFSLCSVQYIPNAGDGLAEQPEGAHEAVGEEVELGEVGQRGIHCPGKMLQLKTNKNQ